MRFECTSEKDRINADINKLLFFFRDRRVFRTQVPLLVILSLSLCLFYVGKIKRIITDLFDIVVYIIRNIKQNHYCNHYVQRAFVIHI